MDGIRIISGLENILRYCLAGMLGVWATVSFFVFLINWETWFFGIKLDGLPAGLYLFAKAVVAALLAYATMRYPRKIFLTSIMALLYFGFLFIDSAWTIQKNTHGQHLFSGMMAFCLVVPLVLIIVHRIAESRTGS